MKLHFITLTTLITACCAASIPVDTHKEVNLFKELDLNMSGADALDIEKVAATGLTDLLSKGKKAFSLVNVLKDVLGMISKIDQIQDSEEMGLAKEILLKIC